MSKGFSWSLDGILGGFFKKYVAQKGPGLWIWKFSKMSDGINEYRSPFLILTLHTSTVH